MPGDRLFEMVYLLMEHPMTARELAQRFEVSTRTIYRDVETLSQAGIPVYTDRGQGGGIRLMEGFVLNKSVLTETEQQELLAAVQGMNALRPGDSAAVMRRLAALFGGRQESWLKVDLSDWSFQSSEIYETVKAGILSRRVLAFDYYSSAGTLSSRKVQPLELWFKSKNWYLRAFCLHRQDWRTFRLTRIKRPQLLDETFVPRQPNPETAYEGGIAAVALTLWIDASQAYRVYDDFSEEEIERQRDGSFVVRPVYPEGEWVYGMILSYGSFAKVLAPEAVRLEIVKRLQRALESYGAE